MVFREGEFPLSGFPDGVLQGSHSLWLAGCVHTSHMDIERHELSFSRCQTGEQPSNSSYRDVLDTSGEPSYR